MRIRFLTSVAGARFAYRVKKEYDLREDIAREFVKSGVAVVVDGPVPSALMQPADKTLERPVKRGRFGRALGAS